jgi:predicted DNA-binding transcriptional regulator AlpA
MSDTKPVLSLEDLGVLLGRSPETIRKDLRRNPAAVPPRIIISGTRLLRWRAIDVHSWMAQRVEGGSHV